MKRIMLCSIALMALLVASCLPALAQGGGSTSLSGTVLDPSGLVIPGADITVKNEATGVEYKVVTTENGTFFVPSLPPGTYTVTAIVTGFKTAEVKAVAVEAAVPASIRPIKMEIGSKSDTVIVQAGGEVLQTQSAAVSTTIIGRQITELPFTSRDALDLVVLMPGTYTSTNPRSSTVNGLPQSTLYITIDGINVQSNDSKAGDGFYTWVRPRIDAVEQVTVSTSAQSAESSGEGTVQIKFVTRSGSNNFNGGLYEYHRNPSLAANYWFSNRDQKANADKGEDWRTWKAPRDRILLNQFGARIGGPIIAPKKLFGPLAFDGHDRAFFFANYEEFHIPQAVSATRTILHPRTQQGYYRYVVTNPDKTKVIKEVNVLDVAKNLGQLYTPDPTVTKLLQDIRSAAESQGTINTAISEDPYFTSNPNLQPYTFREKGIERRVFPTVRLDFMITRNHRIENSYNYQRFLEDGANTFNGTDPVYPGSPNYGVQTSNRFSDSLTLRSTFTSKLVNEARVGVTGGTALFYTNVTADTFNGPNFSMGGYYLTGFYGVTNPIQVLTPSRNSAPAKQAADNLTWTHGTHNFSFGWDFSNVVSHNWGKTLVPEIDLMGGSLQAGDPANIMFTGDNRKLYFPGASSSTTAPISIYTMLTGRVGSVTGNAQLGPDGKYYYIGPRDDKGRMRQMGFFASDSWRIKPNLALTGGLRWEVQLAYAGLNDSYSTVTVEDIYGITGYGNLMKPGTMTGSPMTYKAYEAGTPLYPNFWKDLGPSVGFAWTPKFEGLLGKFIGDGRTVLRGGFSQSFTRYGTDEFSGILTSTPGRYYNANRNDSRGNLVVAGDPLGYPVLFRQRERLGPGLFPESPVYPNTGTTLDGGAVFDPTYRMPYTLSWNISLQREVSKNMVIEARYVGNRATQFQMTTSVNSTDYNVLENGLLDEFWIAQANMYANYAAGKGLNWGYSGVPGTSPLPISLAFINGPGKDPNNPSSYSSSRFTQGTAYFEKTYPAPDYLGSLFDGNATYRANGLAAGYPANFFRANPDKRGSVYFKGNGGRSQYDSLQVEFRRRMASGLLVQASYTYARGFSLTSPDLRAPRYKNPNTYSGTGALKANWIYELPIGRGKTLLADMGPKLNRMFGGWEFHGIFRWNTRSISVSDFQMIGMTRQDLQNMVKLRFDDARGIVYDLAADFIANSIAAYQTDVTNQPSGYSSQYGVPTGRFVAPATYNNCPEIWVGQCGHGGFVINGNPFTRFDLSLVKRANITERVGFELRAEFLNAFNNANFLTGTSFGSTSMGRVTSAYRDPSTTNDPGGRLVQFVGRINF